MSDDRDGGGGVVQDRMGHGPQMRPQRRAAQTAAHHDEVRARCGLDELVAAWAP